LKYFAALAGGLPLGSTPAAAHRPPAFPRRSTAFHGSRRVLQRAGTSRLDGERRGAKGLLP